MQPAFAIQLHQSDDGLHTDEMDGSKHTVQLLGVGLYSLQEAARLLQTSPSSVRRWIGGYDYSLGDKVRNVPPLWSMDLPAFDDQFVISFRDLIELRFVKAFISKGIGLKAVRNCINYARQCVESDRPFSTGRFRTDGQTIFLESIEASKDAKLLDLKGKQYVFKQIVERSFKDLDLEHDMVARWRPYRGKQTIVLDPQRAFGQPIAEATGVPTVVLAQAVKAEGSVARVSAIFEIDKAVIHDAVRFQEELMAA